MPLTLGGSLSGRGWCSKEQVSHLYSLSHFPCLPGIPIASFELLSKVMVTPNGQPSLSGLLPTAFGRLVNTGY